MNVIGEATTFFEEVLGILLVFEVGTVELFFLAFFADEPGAVVGLLYFGFLEGASFDELTHIPVVAGGFET